MKRRTLFITIGVVMVVSLIIPILCFWLKFRFFNFSSNISDWGNFGSYIGGVITPIISIYSMIILGYITYLLSENSNEENRKLHILQKKLDAYEEFTKFFPRFNQAPLKLKYILEGVARDINEIGTDKELLKKESERIFLQVEFFVEFYYFLFNFNLRYGHLFKYNFESNDFKQALSLSRQIKDDYLSIYECFISLDLSALMIKEKDSKIEEMLDYLVNFINAVREELEQ